MIYNAVVFYFYFLFFGNFFFRLMLLLFLQDLTVQLVISTGGSYLYCDHTL